MRKFSEGPALSMGPFQKVESEVIYFPYVVTKNEISKKLSKNFTINGKYCEVSGQYNF